MYKTIQITLPFDEKISEKILQYTPEENNCILEIGINCYEKGKKDIINMTETEMIKKNTIEYNKKIEKLEREIFNEQESRNYIVESLKKIYEDEKNNVIKKCENLENELKRMKKEEESFKKQEEETKILIQKEIDKALNAYKENMNIIIDEKNKIIEKKEIEIERDREFREKYREDNTKMLQLLEGKNNYSNLKEKGNAGESLFNELSDDAFGEIEGYELKNTSAIKHSGDFHLHFKDFGVLVDLKNYDSNIPLKEVIKIENDFKKNSHLKFAWLISLNTKIQNNDKGIFTYKIIENGRCIFYINELLKQTNQIRVIKSLYYFCKMISSYIKDNDTNEDEENNENIQYKKNYNEVIQEVNTIKKEIYELNSSITVMKNISDRLQYKINNILKREIDSIICETKLNDIFNDWFNNNYEICEVDNIIKSKDLWIKFKKDNYEIDNIDIEKFKDMIYKNIHEDNLILPKYKKGTIEIINYKEKKSNNKTKKNVLHTDNTDIMQVLIDKVEKKKKEKISEYFSDEDKEKILHLYSVELKDIMEIKDILGINDDDVYKIVSLLVNLNVISSRTVVRGYEKYKETEAYKNKSIKNNNVIIINNKKKEA